MPILYPFGTSDYQRGHVDVGGNVYFVRSEAAGAGLPAGRDSLTAGRTVTAPFATIAYAVQRCVAGRGDVIYALPSHVEPLTSATQLALNVAGVTVQGLGYGLNRPIIRLQTATTTTIPVSAANITLKNLVFSANFADVVSFFTLGAARDFRVEGCLFKPTVTDMNALHVFDLNTTDNAADGLTFVNNEWFEPDAATLAFMLLDSAVDRMHIQGNTMVTGNATIHIPMLISGATGKNMTNLRIYDNELYMTGNASSTAGLLIVTDATAGSGVIARNNLYTADATTELLITATHTFALFNNLVTGTFNAQGRLVPGADS